MEQYQTICVEKSGEHGEVEWLTLNRPDRLNTLTKQMVHELCGYLASKVSDADTRVIVMRGAGRAFCAGFDMKETTTVADAERNEAGKPVLLDIMPLMRKIPQPIVALVHGAACGGGMAIALAADFRFVGSSLKMNAAFAKIGLTGCELGVSYFLPRLVGLERARELQYTGRFIGAQRAVEIGLASACGADDELADLAQPLIDDMLLVSPTGLRLTKKTLDRCIEVDDLESVIAIEGHAQSLCARTGDLQEAMRAFAEKRAPNFAR